MSFVSFIVENLDNNKNGEYILINWKHDMENDGRQKAIKSFPCDFLWIFLCFVRSLWSILYSMRGF